MKGSEMKAIVLLAIMLVGCLSLFGYINSMRTSNENQDINSATETTSNYLVDYTIGEIVAAFVLIFVGIIIAILVALKVIKK